MFINIWKFFRYVLSGQMALDNQNAYVQSKNPKNEKERHNAIRSYSRIRGGY